MSELKAVHAFDVYEAYTKTGDDDAAQVYLKSEADKVIAEKDAEIAKLKESVKGLILDNYLKDKEIAELKKQVHDYAQGFKLAEEKMIEPGKLNGHLVRIKEELRKAEAKHPKFCDKMTNCVSADFMKKSELLYKRFNSKPPYSAESILEEEIREALSAYLEGDKVHALEELAQCGAVILRMMDFVAAEIEKESK